MPLARSSLATQANTKLAADRLSSSASWPTRSLHSSETRIVNTTDDPFVGVDTCYRSDAQCNTAASRRQRAECGSKRLNSAHHHRSNTMADFSSLLGRLVERRKACPACGCVQFKVEAGKGPHALHLRCAGCNRGGFWIGLSEARRMAGRAA